MPRPGTPCSFGRDSMKSLQELADEAFRDASIGAR